MNGHNQPDPNDVPGFNRATGIDDPTPRAEYRDEAQPPHVEPPETCDLCREQPPEYETTVSFEQGPDVQLDLCTGCRIHIEDSGEVDR